jgi:hypothetical protein
MGAAYPIPMSAALRRAIFIVFGTLWASGCGWLWLHLFFARPAAFGSIEHPWQPGILRLHGWLAVAGVFLLGWVMANHISARWPQATKRASGLAMAAAAAVLALSGYALYYTTDNLHDFAAIVHEVVGAAAILFALSHWRRYRLRVPARSSAKSAA